MKLSPRITAGTSRAMKCGDLTENAIKRDAAQPADRSAKAVRNCFFISTLLLFLPVFISSSGIGTSLPDARLATDAASAAYKTTYIDDKIQQLPAGIRNGISENPEAGMTKLIEYITVGAENDFIKVKRIHDLITDSIDYDNDAFSSGKKESHNGYAAIKARRGTCGEFARIFQMMAQSAGLSAILIHGQSRKSWNAKTGRMADHIWNAVSINSKWYLVDTTHDTRFSFSGGKFSSKAAYKDTHLFISAAAKIIDNRPNEDQYQFLENVVNEADFLKKPFVSMLYVKYGIEFTSDVNGFIRKEKIANRPESRQQALVEKAYLGKESVSITLLKPENVTVYGKIKNASGKIFGDHAACSENLEKVICTFSAPGSGEFTAYISGRFNNPMEKVATQIYTFQVIGSAGEGPRIVAK